MLLRRCLSEYTEISLRQHTTVPLNTRSSEAKAAAGKLMIFNDFTFSMIDLNISINNIYTLN